MKILGLTLSSLLFIVQLAVAAPAATKSTSATSVKKTTNTQTQKGGKSAKKTIKAQSTQKYKVRKGDSLYTIAHAHGMKLGELQRLNNIRDNRIKPGQTLLVKGSAKSRTGQSKKQAPELAAATPSHGELAQTSDTITGDPGVEPIALSYLSIPYRYGAESRRSTDCSGFTQQVFQEFDIKLPRTAREQYTVGSNIEREALQTGDLLFFRTRAKKKYPTHVGIYLGDGKMIHASSKHRKVIVSSIDHPYYLKRYIGAKRVALFLPGDLNLDDVARQIGELDQDFAGYLSSDTARQELESVKTKKSAPSVEGADSLMAATGDDSDQQEHPLLPDNQELLNQEEGEDDIDAEPEPEPLPLQPQTVMTQLSPT